MHNVVFRLQRSKSILYFKDLSLKISLQHGTNKLFTKRKGSRIRRCSSAYRSNTAPVNRKFSFLNDVIHHNYSHLPDFFPGTQFLIRINTVMNILPLVDFTISLTCIQNSLYSNTPALSSDTQHSTTMQMCWKMEKGGEWVQERAGKRGRLCITKSGIKIN